MTKKKMDNRDCPKESPERLGRPLIQLAKLANLGTFYFGQAGDYHEIEDDVLVDLLATLGFDASSDEAIGKSTRALLDDTHRRLVAPTVLHAFGKEDQIAVNTEILQIPSATISMENGQPYPKVLQVGPGDGSPAYDLSGTFITSASIIIPADLPVGYHTIHVKVGERTQDATLISAPESVDIPQDLLDGRLWGWASQLYSLRSPQCWGVGDFEELRSLVRDAKEKTGADFFQINPVHATEPVSPLTPSPYLPVSRRFVNFTYIRPESIEEYQSLDEQTRQQISYLHQKVEPLNGDPQLIDRDAMWRAKMRALWMIFKFGRNQVRQSSFEAFKHSQGQELDYYAAWCLCYDKWGAPQDSSGNWEHNLSPDSPEVSELCSNFPDTLDFYRWLEWISCEQLQLAQKTAQESGMAIGILADMAAGVHTTGFDAWAYPERFARNVTAGAPPDYFSQQGQNWNQLAFDPSDLEKTGYRAYRELIHNMFTYSGALRIDHILGLFRLWWIPRGRDARQGAYVFYDSAIMLGILCLEAGRAGGLIIGEDLGVVPDYVVESLRSHKIFGCCVEWFEHKDGKFIPPSQWRTDALACVNTHDMSPAAGYLQYEQVKIREQLNLLSSFAKDFKSEAVAEHNALLTMLINQGLLDPQLVEDEQANLQQIVEAQYRALTASPSKLLAVSIVDGVGERRAQNQPGTDREYPNWSIPLADDKGDVVEAQELFDNPRMQSLAAVIRRGLNGS